MRGAEEHEERLPRAQAQDLRGHAHAQGSQAEKRQLLPRGRDRALPEGRPSARGRRGRDVRHGHQHQKGPEDSREAGRRQALQGPGERHCPEPGRRRGRAALPRPLGHQNALPLARRHLREVQKGRACCLNRRRHGHRLRRRGLEARAGDIGRGHRVLRLLEGSTGPSSSSRTPTRASSAP